ncbi:MAG: hypothetical protein IIC24_06600 [Chloroflexi bacterium]|nr:hypothetical protein [Chloroflexota bacterium]
MELKDLLKNDNTVPFSRLRFLNRFASDEQVEEFLSGLYTAVAHGRYKGNYDGLDEFLDHWEQMATDMLFKIITMPDLEGNPWATMSRPLSESKVALVTTGGVYLKEEEKFERGDHTFRELPSDITQEEVRIWHPGYDRGPAMQDINCIFPINRFRELAAEGIIGSLADTHYSFMGLILDTTALIEESAPEAARRLKAAGVDAAFLAST